MKKTVITPTEVNSLINLSLPILKEDDPKNFTLIENILENTQRDTLHFLGVQFGDKILKEYLSESETNEVKFLFEGGSKENFFLKGLNFVVASLSSFEYIQQKEVNYTEMGVQIADAQNSTKVSSRKLLNSLYNSASVEFEKIVYFLEKNSTDYPNFMSEYVELIGYRSSFNF